MFRSVNVLPFVCLSVSFCMYVYQYIFLCCILKRIFRIFSGQRHKIQFIHAQNKIPLMLPPVLGHLRYIMFFPAFRNHLWLHVSFISVYHMCMSKMVLYSDASLCTCVMCHELCGFPVDTKILRCRCFDRCMMICINLNSKTSHFSCHNTLF